MKKILVLLTFLIIVSLQNTEACNTCGCGVSNYHYGIVPQFQKNFIGLRYRYRSYTSRLDESHTTAYSYETFQSAELWGRFYPFKRVQAFVFIPYNMNWREEGTQVTHLEGLGDMVLSASYNLLNSYDSTASNFTQSLLVGAGVKFPTGAYRAIENGLTVNQNFQLGTGSTDLLFNLIHTLRYKKTGINTEFTYNFNTTNQDEYRFGNTTKTGITGFYVLNVGALTMMPNAGASLETYEDNKQFGAAFEDTGGWAMLYTAGLEAYYRNIAMGFSYTHPGEQQLFSGKVSSNDRLAAHITFMF
jgi:hypothetical protein